MPDDAELSGILSRVAALKKNRILHAEKELWLDAMAEALGEWEKSL